MLRGRFVTFEGIEGSGKSTQVARLATDLGARGVPVRRTHEPGEGLDRELRTFVLERARLRPMSEAFFMVMDRHEHVERVIRPALEQGQLVLCDRFADSTLAYQGGGSGLDLADLATLNRLATGGLVPDLTFLFDLPVEIALARVRERAPGKKLDRFEAEALAFHERVRATYLALAAAEPARFRIVDAARAADPVFADIARTVDALLATSA